MPGINELVEAYKKKHPRKDALKEPSNIEDKKAALKKVE